MQKFYDEIAWGETQVSITYYIHIYTKIISTTFTDITLTYLLSINTYTNIQIEKIFWNSWNQARKVKSQKKQWNINEKCTNKRLH